MYPAIFLFREAVGFRRMIDCFMHKTIYKLGKKVWKDDWKNWTSEELHLYISVCANIRLLMKEAGLPLEPMAAA
jgi:hypothetical protein